MRTSPSARREDVQAPALPALPRSLTELLGFQIRMAQGAFHRDFTAAMSGLNLTQRQMAVLEIVAQSRGISQVDIATQLSTDRATMMAIVDRLQDRRRGRGRFGRVLGSAVGPLLAAALLAAGRSSQDVLLILFPALALSGLAAFILSLAPRGDGEVVAVAQA